MKIKSMRTTIYKAPVQNRWCARAYWRVGRKRVNLAFDWSGDNAPFKSKKDAKQAMDALMAMFK